MLLDVVMPRMGGEECMRRLRQLAPDPPVIVMSGWTEVELARRFADQEHAGLLSKPFRVQDLLTQLTRLVPGGKRRDFGQVKVNQSEL